MAYVGIVEDLDTTLAVLVSSENAKCLIECWVFPLFEFFDKINLSIQIIGTIAKC